MAVDFTLTSAQRRLRTRAAEFANDVLAPGVAQVPVRAKPEERFAATRPVYEQVIRAGFLKRILPTSAGGGAGSMMDVALLAEEFMAVDVNVPLTLVAVTLGLTPVIVAGTEQQKQQMLAPFLKRTGAPLAAFAFTEPGGSANFDADAPGAGIRTTARLDRGRWVINGTKKWVSSASGWDGGGPDLMCVVCRTDTDVPTAEGLSVIAVPGPVTGLEAHPASELLGHRAHLTPTVTLRDVRAPRANVLGRPGDGRRIVGEGFLPAAALVGVFGLALMRTAFDFALEFARTERRGGAVPIIEHQAVGYALADAKSRIEATRYLTWRALRALDVGAPAARELALHAKIFGSDTAVRVITDLMNVVGVDSYSHDLPLAGLLADALALPLFGGSNSGVRRRQLQSLFAAPGYDAYETFLS